MLFAQIDPMTEAEFVALGETGQRHEVIDGVLLTRPAPDLRHQRISARLRLALDEAVPNGCEVLGPINLRLAIDRIVIPDISVLTTPGGDKLVASAAEVLMMIEIVSPSTEPLDRILKPALAAESRIPFYGLVEPDGPTVTISALDGDGYRVVTKATGDEPLALTQPFPLDFRPADLLATRR
ncbi:Uma2 family endonuclease [Cryptosporangium phraense]|uniref:Uma2 family endonuclease n=1 Tax=Cryptosporangium phraense TaxID=2593070 RepID=A0A545AR03_9ACTN|nr:Uma2 family endonuclease [Cryptosporangium phraense]TQS43756.1 Uma2 family endonuclease [Cryptosporangium phraense]